MTHKGINFHLGQDTTYQLHIHENGSADIILVVRDQRVGIYFPRAAWTWLKDTIQEMKPAPPITNTEIDWPKSAFLGTQTTFEADAGPIDLGVPGATYRYLGLDDSRTDAERTRDFYERSGRMSPRNPMEQSIPRGPSLTMPPTMHHFECDGWWITALRHEKGVYIQRTREQVMQEINLSTEQWERVTELLLNHADQTP